MKTNKFFLHCYSFLYRLARITVSMVRLGDLNFSKIRTIAFVDNSRVSRNPKIVLAGLVGLNPDMLAQTLVGVALRRSGAEIIQLSCDSAMKFCFNAKVAHYQGSVPIKRLLKYGQGAICEACQFKSSRYATSGKFLNYWLTKYLKDEDWPVLEGIKQQTEKEVTIATLRAFTFQGIKIGEHAYSAAVRFFASPMLQDQNLGIDVLREYLLSAAVTALAFQRFLDKNPVDMVLVDHGIYVPQGVITEISKKNGIRILTFNTGYRKSTFLFSEGDSYHFAIPRSKEFLSRKYSKHERDIALDYVESRASGKSDWVHFQPKVSKRKLLVDETKIHIGVFPNVLWDADVHFDESIFQSSSEWLLKTLHHLRKQLNVIVHLRIHPGEKKGAVVSRYGVSDLLREIGVCSNSNLVIYDAEDETNSYALADLCSYSVVYGSKIGIDLAALGHRVLTAGDCWTRDKGVTTDPKTTQEYFYLLDNPDLITVSPQRALDFAYYLYFERMYSFGFVSKRSGDPPFSIDHERFEMELSDKASDITRLIGEIIK